jgi:hypothetical protein
MPVSDQCQTHNASNGWCLTCYQGYALTDVLSNNSVIDRVCNLAVNDLAVTHPGCKTFRNGSCA